MSFFNHTDEIKFFIFDKVWKHNTEVHLLKNFVLFFFPNYYKGEIICMGHFHLLVYQIILLFLILAF